MKQKFSTVDVAAEVACLKNCLGLRCANLYSFENNSKVYMLKLARSGEAGEKVFLVLESGVRFHTTKWAKEKADTPSNFTLKLRKHLRTRRLEDVRQLGVDRIVDFSFGSGEACHHLILELFAQGNVILTDHKYEILTLLRSHRDDAKGVAIMARHVYPLQTIRLRVRATDEALDAALAQADAKRGLRGVVGELLPYGAALWDHVLLTAGLDPQRNLQTAPLTSNQKAALMSGIAEAEAALDAFDAQPPGGFIWQKRQGQKGGKKGEKPASEHNSLELSEAEQPLMYDDFGPLAVKQNEGQPVVRFDTFDVALDDFFAKIEGQRAQQVQSQQQTAVLSKVEKIRLDQTRRAEALEREAQEEELKASLIEYNLEAVDGAIAAVRSALAGGLKWKELKRLIKTEREAGNPVAALIHSLELEANRITLLLSNLLDEEEGDDDANTRTATKVEIDLDLNAYANARVHFENRKARAAKQQKTVEQNVRALKAAEKTAQIKLSQVKAAKQVQVLRKPYWFEKFHWFVTSENFLVVSGRDMQQNELLVKRYMKKGDLYVHAELHGASTTIVKNHTPDSPVPPMSVAQAGCACVCRSQAWDAKIVTSAWFVYPQQVSKTAPTGEYLPTGSFIIRGKKNFLPPQPLIMGLGFLFRLDESSLAEHVGERAVRGGGEGSEAPEALEEAVEPQIANEDLPGEILTAGTATSSEGSAFDAFMDSSADQLGRLNIGHQRYGLPSPSAEDTASANHANEAEEGGKKEGGDSIAAGRRHLSAAERRSMKKQGDESTGQVDEAERAALAEARKQEAARRAAKQQADLQSKSEAAAAVTRGKKGKAKKAQAKYANQDEEDRALALQLLDPAGKKKGKGEKKEARKARKQDDASAEVAGSRRAAPTAEELARVGARIDPRSAMAAATAPLQDTDGHAAEAANDAANGTISVPDNAASPPVVGQERAASAEHQTPAQLNGGGGSTGLSNTEGSKDDNPDGSGMAFRFRSNTAEASEDAAVATAPQAAGNGYGQVVSLDGQGIRPEGQGVSPDEQGGGNDKANEEYEREAESSGEGGGLSEDESAEGTPNTDAEGQTGGTAEAEEVAALMAEEQIELLPEAELSQLREVDALTGQPRPDDILLHALPVCAPYSALTGYKHRIKITPGSQKKGKAARQVVELLTRSADTLAKEKELMRAIPEQEIISAMVANVKISMPGLQKIQNEARSQKKKNKPKAG